MSDWKLDWQQWEVDGKRQRSHRGEHEGRVDRQGAQGQGPTEKRHSTSSGGVKRKEDGGGQETAALCRKQGAEQSGMKRRTTTSPSELSLPVPRPSSGPSCNGDRSGMECREGGTAPETETRARECCSGSSFSFVLYPMYPPAVPESCEPEETEVG